MLGSLRFFLACLVALSHLDGRYLPLNLGIVAVVVFYFISGHLMNRSYRRFADGPRASGKFYLDRVIRLYPTYVVVFALSFAVLTFAGRLNPDFSTVDFFANLLLLPTNWYLDASFLVIRPSWSLAAEFFFYLLVPLLFALDRRVLAALAVVLCAVHLGSFWVSFTLTDFGVNAARNEYYWNHLSALMAYKWPFLILSVFIMGFLAAEAPRCRYCRNAGLVMWASYAIFLFAAGQASGAIHNRCIAEVALGAVVGPPLVLLIINSRVPEAFKAWDRQLGGLAFPLFLVHPAAFVLAEAIAYGSPAGRLLFVYAAWVLSFALAYLVWKYIDQRLTILRYAVRGFDRLALKSAA